MSLSFLKEFNKSIDAEDGISSDSSPPAYWYSLGNVVLNKIMSGSFRRGVPQGRVVGLAGPSGAGKSFVMGNICAAAQKAGAHLFVIDSENALDDSWMTNVGVDVTEGYTYKGVTTLANCISATSKFISMYDKAYGKRSTNPDQPQVLIVIDSLDMMTLDNELEAFKKGTTKGDQGQRAKQLKAYLRQLVHQVKNYNMAVVVTSQVYAASAEQLLQGEGRYVVNGAVRFALSQIILLTKLKLKGEKAVDVTGIRMKAEGFKTRFTKPFQTVTVEVPYETGIDQYSGLIEALEAAGVLTRSGSWYKNKDESIKFQSKNLDQYAELLIEEAEAMSLFLSATVSDDEIDDDTETVEAADARRAALALASED